MWIILDIGFANQAKSCGIIIDENEPQAHRFSSAIGVILKKNY